MAVYPFQMVIFLTRPKSNDSKQEVVVMQPIQKFQAGAVIASVWKNTSKEGAEYFSVSLDKRYKDAQGDWKSSSSFKPADLPKAALLMNKAYEFIVLKHDAPVEA
ncbi:MAG: hypothetical protein Q8P05_05010 [Candidatus Diapherotrites archaeon]|nr:hypothetical protein [Candidatus Diapherotrites archaeon]